MTILPLILICQLPVTVLVDDSPAGAVARLHWEAQTGTGDAAQRHQLKFKRDTDYLRKHFDVEVIEDVRLAPGRDRPLLRFGYGGPWIRFSSHAVTSGLFVKAVADACREYRWELTDEYRLKDRYVSAGCGPEKPDASCWLVRRKKPVPLIEPVEAPEPETIEP